MKQGKPNRTLIETNESGLPQGILTACWAKDQRKSKRLAVMAEISIEHPIAIVSTLKSGRLLMGFRIAMVEANLRTWERR